MKNPWLNLPARNPYILQIDRDAVDSFNEQQSPASKAIIQTQLFPEPFIGNPRSPIYLLSLNPGFSGLDNEWHRNKAFLKASRENLEHATNGFLFLDEQFEDAPGSLWWRKRLRWLMKETSHAHVFRSLFCVELSPYHSTRFKSIPRSLSETGLVPSSDYGAHLIQNSINEGKSIIAMRAWKKWCKRVPQLAKYKKVFRLNSVQNVSLSPNNLDGFKKIVRLIGEDK